MKFKHGDRVKFHNPNKYTFLDGTLLEDRHPEWLDMKVICHHREYFRDVKPLTGWMVEYAGSTSSSWFWEDTLILIDAAGMVDTFKEILSA